MEEKCEDQSRLGPKFAKEQWYSPETDINQNFNENYTPTTQEMTLHTHGHLQMINTEIRLIIFFTAKAGEALYSQQKQDWELTVAQTMNSLLPNSDLNWRT